MDRYRRTELRIIRGVAIAESLKSEFEKATVPVSVLAVGVHLTLETRQ
jgi:hypothetical protein